MPRARGLAYDGRARRPLGGATPPVAPRRLFRRLVAQGREEGAETLRRAVAGVLRARGLAVPASLAAELAACSDLARLERWVERAAVVVRAEELCD